MEIEHLALAVRDPARSARFYLETIGVTGSCRDEDWGVRLTTDQGFMLALIRGEPVPAEVIGRVHFGCALKDPEAVYRARERLRAAGLPEVEWWEEPGYVSVKVADPDGYVVELAYDVQ